MENSNKMGGELWKVLALCFFGTTVIYLPYFGHSTQTTTMMEEFGLNYTQMGWLDSITALTAGIVLIFMGLVTYYWGARNVTLLGLAVAVVGEFLFAFSTGYGYMIFCRILHGIALAMVFVGPYAMVLRWFERTRHLGFALGVMVACDGAGGLITLYLFAIVLVAFGWKLGTIFATIALLVLLVLCFFFLKEPETWEQMKADREDKPEPLLKSIKETFLNRNVIVACLFSIPVFGIYSVAAYWVPSALMEDAGWSESASGLVGALFSASGMLAFVFGIWSDHMGKRKPLTIVSGIGTAVSFGILTIAYIQGYYVLVAIMLVSSGFFAYCGLLLVYYLVSDDIGAIKSASSTGLIQAVGYLIGGFIFPIVVGYFRDSTDSYAVGFTAITISVVILAVIGVFPGKDTPVEMRKE